MSTTKELTCINCPLGCSIKVEMDNGEIKSIVGNTCERGKIYAQNEVTNPVRVVTSSVSVNNGNVRVVSVKTKTAIPKDKIFDCARAMKNIVVDAPVKIGDVICEDIADTGISLVATSNVETV